MPADGVAPGHPMVPVPYRVRSRLRQSHDTVNLALDPLGPEELTTAPGQFNMLYVFGVGEIPISVSGFYRAGRPLSHTVRSVGAVSEALCRARRGDVVGVRGPFGTSWGVADAEGADLVLVAGGVGLAPLRSALHEVLARRSRYGRVVLLVGARAPEEILFGRELDRLSRRSDVEVGVTVDQATGIWTGDVGVVTQLLPGAAFDPSSALALVCGPEIMMRFAAQALLGRGMPSDRIRVSLERNMKCALGWCGHCQLGPAFVCKDGPVFPYDRAADLLAVKER